MAQFNDLSLFDSGPHCLTIGGLSLRHRLHETIKGQGVQISSLGRSGRKIVQTGDLLADDASSMRTIIQAIENMLDGQAYVLRNSLNTSWPNTVMLAFEPKKIRPVGTRLATAYTVTYLQLVAS